MCLVLFTITTYDMEGNMQTVNGQYLVTPEQENGGETPPLTNGEENGGSEPPTEPEDNTFLIVVGAIVIVVIAYAVWSYIRGLTEEE